MTREFDGDELRSAYEPALRVAATEHRPDCPSAEALQAAVAGKGAERERLVVLDRALTCPACRRELALLQAIGAVESRERTAVVRRSAWTRLVPLAVAATVLLAVGLTAVNIWRGKAAPLDDVLRAGLTGAPVLLAPASGAAVSQEQLQFVWRTVPGALRYSLELDASDGTVLFGATTNDTSYTRSLVGTPVGEHRWLVRARMDDGTERRSEARILRVR